MWLHQLSKAVGAGRIHIVGSEGFWEMHVCGTEKDYINFHSKVVVSNRQWVGEADQVAAQSAHNLVISSSANCLPFSPLRGVRGKVACSRIHLENQKYHMLKCHQDLILTTHITKKLKVSPCGQESHGSWYVLVCPPPFARERWQ